MTEFKQIIGRGTRINDDYHKHWFTILDFKKATELFADPDFDGDPVKVYQPRGDDPIVPDDELAEDDVTPGDSAEALTEIQAEGIEDNWGDYAVEPGATWQSDDTGADITVEDAPAKRVKYVVDDVEVSVVAERVQYLGPDGKLITESLRDYTRKKVKEQFASLDDFLRRWHDAERKQAILEELEENGIFWEDLVKDLGDTLGDEPDPFDVICHIAFDRPPLTRRERAEQVRKRDLFSRYEGQARQVLESLLDKYADAGITPIEDINVLNVAPFSEIGTVTELVTAFGGKPGYTRALHELEDALYQPAG
jgi:type I restriction enzyme R subunit